MVQKSDSGTPPEGPRDPFAPPPKDAPDRPWQPRQHPAHPGERGWANEDPPQGAGPGGREEQDGPQDGQGGGPEDADGRQAPQRPVVPPPHPWSPGYQGGTPPNLGYGPPQQQLPRFDPSDPVQRRARYALLSGMWGIFFLILAMPYVTLALASLALYWSISSLRGTARTPVAALTAGGSSAAVPAPGPSAAPPQQQPSLPAYLPGYVPPYATKPQLPAALGGLIASVVGLSLVAVVFGVQLYYKNYYDCQRNALTKSTYDKCATSVSPQPPEWLRKLNGDN